MIHEGWGRRKGPSAERARLSQDNLTMGGLLVVVVMDRDHRVSRAVNEHQAADADSGARGGGYVQSRAVREGNRNGSYAAQRRKSRGRADGETEPRTGGRRGG